MTSTRSLGVRVLRTHPEISRWAKLSRRRRGVSGYLHCGENPIWKKWQKVWDYNQRRPRSSQDPRVMTLNWGRKRWQSTSCSSSSSKGSKTRQGAARRRMRASYGWATIASNDGVSSNGWCCCSCCNRAVRQWALGLGSHEYIAVKFLEGAQRSRRGAEEEQRSRGQASFMDSWIPCDLTKKGADNMRHWDAHTVTDQCTQTRRLTGIHCTSANVSRDRLTWRPTGNRWTEVIKQTYETIEQRLNNDKERRHRERNIHCGACIINEIIRGRSTEGKNKTEAQSKTETGKRTLGKVSRRSAETTGKSKRGETTTAGLFQR